MDDYLITDEMVETAARAMDHAYNPERHPILAAMFRPADRGGCATRRGGRMAEGRMVHHHRAREASQAGAAHPRHRERGDRLDSCPRGPDREGGPEWMS